MKTTQRAIREEIERLAKSYGVEVEFVDWGGKVEVLGDSPKGVTFNASGCHAIVSSGRFCERWSVLRSALEDWRAGVERFDSGTCDDPECGVCYPDETEVSAPVN